MGDALKEVWGSLLPLLEVVLPLLWRTTRPGSGMVRPTTSEAKVGSETKATRKKSFMTEVSVQASQKLEKNVQEKDLNCARIHRLLI